MFITFNGEKPFDSYADWVEPVLRDPVANAFVTGCAFQWFGDVGTPLVRRNCPGSPVCKKIKWRFGWIWLDLLGFGWIRVDFGLIGYRVAPEGFFGRQSSVEGE